MIDLKFHSQLPLAHFTLQYDYAKRASQILNIPIDQALLEFTQFWRRIHDPAELSRSKMDWSFNPTTPQWRELCNRIKCNEPADTVAYDLYIKNNGSSELGKKYFGCFRYDFIHPAGNNKGIIKLHFKNRDTSGYGPLTKDRKGARCDDLKAMFKSINLYHPGAEIVQGGSWLYNLDSYRRLFPKIFTRNMKVEETPFPRSSGIWGQFLTSNSQVNDRMKHNFLLKANDATNVHQLLQCFEFKILFPTTGIANFYRHFEV